MKIDLVKDGLHKHQLEAARTFVTKAGVTEATDRLMEAIKEVGTNVRSVNDRLVRAIDNRPRGHAD